MLPALHHRREDGRLLPLLGWELSEPWTVCSTAPVGGGLGPRHWVLNAQVGAGYLRTDLAAHVGELAALAGLDVGWPGVGLLTAADVDDAVHAGDDGVAVTVTAGVRIPTWAAAPAGAPDAVTSGGRVTPGTINVVVWLPAAVTDAALVNLVATVAEAKAQALGELGVPGTGTATDAVVVACPAGGDPRTADPFGGPRSRWGGPVARAVHRGVTEGTRRSLARIASEVAPG